MRTVHNVLDAQRVTQLLLMVGGVLLLAALVLSMTAGSIMNSTYVNVVMLCLAGWAVRNYRQKAVVYDRFSTALAAVVVAASALGLMSVLSV